MTSFAQRCGIHDAAREQAVQRLGRLIGEQGLDLVRFAWCDLHGVLLKACRAHALIDHRYPACVRPQTREPTDRHAARGGATSGS